MEVRKKKLNRKNISNGEIILNQIDPSDKVEPEAEVNDIEDTLLSVLEMEADYTTIFLES